MQPSAILLDPVRTQILDKLMEGEAYVGDIAATIGKPEPATSQHLRLLRQAGFVVCRNRGLRRYYRIAEPRLVPIRQFVRAVRQLAEVSRPPQCAAIGPRENEQPKQAAISLAMRF